MLITPWLFVLIMVAGTIYYLWHGLARIEREDWLILIGVYAFVLAALGDLFVWGK